MKKINPDRITSTILKYLLHLLFVGAFYWALLVSTTSFWLEGFFYKITKIKYALASPGFTQQLYFLLLIYSLFCYVANNFMLDLYHRKTYKQLLISTAVDFLIFPLEIFLMVTYNNLTIKDHLGDITSVYNIYLITALLVIKILVTAKILSNKKPIPKKN